MPGTTSGPAFFCPELGKAAERRRGPGRLAAGAAGTRRAAAWKRPITFT